MDQSLRLRIKEVVRSSLREYVDNFSYASTHPLDTLIPNERKIRSLVGGLETSMGTKLWEPIAKSLGESNGFTVLTEKLLRPEPMPVRLQTTLDNLVTEREHASTWVNRDEVVRRLRSCVDSLSEAERATTTLTPPASGSGVDIYLRKEGRLFAFDTKTVQPNVGDIKKFNKQIIEWYAYAIFKDSRVDFWGRIAYPYNPVKSDFWKSGPHKSGALEPRVDAVVEDEFWDFLSGSKGTFRQLMEIFEQLQGEGFGDELSKVIQSKK